MQFKANIYFFGMRNDHNRQANDPFIFTEVLCNTLEKEQHTFNKRKTFVIDNAHYLKLSFTSPPFLKLSVFLSMHQHTLPRMNVMLDFICMQPVQVRGIRNKHILQNEKSFQSRIPRDHREDYISLVLGPSTA